MIHSNSETLCSITIDGDAIRCEVKVGEKHWVIEAPQLVKKFPKITHRINKSYLEKEFSKALALHEMDLTTGDAGEEAMILAGKLASALFRMNGLALGIIRPLVLTPQQENMHADQWIKEKTLTIVERKSRANSIWLPQRKHLDHQRIENATDCIRAALICLSTEMSIDTKTEPSDVLSKPGLLKDVMKFLNSAIDAIEPEIYKATQFYANVDNVPPRNAISSLQDVVNSKVQQMRNSAQLLPSLFLGDLDSAFRNDPAAASFAEIGHAYPGPRTIAIYRFANLLFKQLVPILPRMLSEQAKASTGIEIHPAANIGKCFFIDHGNGVVIGETTTIHDHVLLYHGVTLGAWNFKYNESGVAIRGLPRHPTICDNVTIYSNTRVYGGETIIGRCSTLGADLVISFDVAEAKQVSRGRDGSIQIKNQNEETLARMCASWPGDMQSQDFNI